METAIEGGGQTLRTGARSTPDLGQPLLQFGGGRL
jgi:hypothetical protein